MGKLKRPSPWLNEPKINAENLNRLSDAIVEFKAADDGIDIRVNESHYSHVLYDDLIERDKKYTYEKPLTYDNIFEEMMKRLAVKPTFKHQCNNCGGVLEMDADNHIFHCPYCNTVYAVGIANVMAR